MKIGFFTDSYLPMHDGVATSVAACAKELEERGHEVYIVAPKHPGYKDRRKNVYRLTSIKFVSKPDVRWALQLPEKSLLQILKIDFDVIHGTSGGGVTFLGLEIAKAKNIPYISTYHTLWNRYTHYFLKGKVIRPRMIEEASRIFGNLCDGLIAPTERVKKELIAYGVKKPIIVLPSGIPLDSYTNVPEGYLKKKIKISDDIKILLYVGRLGKEKSVDFLIESFQLIHQKNPKTVLVLVGSGTEKDKLKQMAKDYGLSDVVYFLGTIKHATMPKIYADADLFLFASKTETQGMVILEAFASGLPVILLKDDAFEGVITNGVNGYAVKGGTKHFAEKAINILNNAKLYNEFSLAARQTADKFSIRETAICLEDIYTHMISTNKHRRRSFRNLQDVRSFLARAKTQMKIFDSHLF